MFAMGASAVFASDVGSVCATMFSYYQNADSETD